MTAGMDTKQRTAIQECCIVILFFLLLLFQLCSIVGCKYNRSSILQNDELNEEIHSDGPNSLRLEDILLRCMKHRIHIFLLRPAILPQATDPAPSTRLRTMCDHSLVNLTKPHLRKMLPLQKKTGLQPLGDTTGGLRNAV